MPITAPVLLALFKRIEMFVLRLRRVKSPNKSAELVRAEIAQLRKDYAQATLPAAFTRYRKAILTTLPSHVAADMFLSEIAGRAKGLPPKHCLGLSAAEISHNKQADRYRVAAQQHNRVPITNPVGLVKIARSLVENPGVIGAGPNAGRPCWYAILVGLALLTGRRPEEITDTGVLTLVKGKGRKSREWVMFDGQAKTRGAEGTALEPFSIPLLAPADFVLNGWDLLRTALPKQNSKAPELFKWEVWAGTRASRASEIMARHFPPGLKLYDLRAIYALLTYDHYAPAACAMQAWTGRVLGHKSLVAPDGSAMPGARVAETATAAFYLRYYLPPVALAQWKRRHPVNIG